VSQRANLPPPGRPQAAEPSAAILGRVVGELPGGIIVASGSGRLRYANHAAARMLGYADPDQVPELLKPLVVAILEVECVPVVVGADKH